MSRIGPATQYQHNAAQSSISNNTTANSTGKGPPMAIRTQVIVRRIDTSGAPLALVATWLAGELSIDSNVVVDVDLSPPDRIAFGSDKRGSPVVRERISTILSQSRFMGWQLSDE